MCPFKHPERDFQLSNMIKPLVRPLTKCHILFIYNWVQQCRHHTKCMIKVLEENYLNRKAFMNEFMRKWQESPTFYLWFNGSITWNYLMETLWQDQIHNLNSTSPATEVIHMTLTSAGMTSSLRNLLVYFHISTTTAGFVCWIIMIVNWSLYEKYNQSN